MFLFTFRRGRSRRAAWAKPPAVQAPWASSWVRTGLRTRLQVVEVLRARLGDVARSERSTPIAIQKPNRNEKMMYNRKTL